MHLLMLGVLELSPFLKFHKSCDIVGNQAFIILTKQNTSIFQQMYSIYPRRIFSRSVAQGRFSLPCYNGTHSNDIKDD